MKLEIYGVKDNVEGGYVFFYQATNEGIMKRIVKSAMLSKEPNVFTTNLKDKSVYLLGSVDTDTGIISPSNPVYAFDLGQVRLELIQEVKLAKQEAGDPKPDASEVVSDEN